MRLFPWLRPSVSLQVAPPRPLAGDMVELRAIVEAPRRRRIERFDLWVEQLVLSSRGRSSRFRLHALLSGPTTLPEGRTELSARAELPSGALPDHRGQRIGVQTLVHLRLSTRWRLDVRGTFGLHVLGAPSTRPAKPLLFSSRQPGSDGPYLEGSLDRSILRPGGMLTGRLSAMGCDARSFVVTLASDERDGALGRPGAHWSLAVDRPLENGASVPFAMGIPPKVTPSYEAGRVRLAWWVELRAERPFARDLTLRIPVDVSVAPRSGEPEENHAAPAVGDERVAAVWRRVAERTGAMFAGDALVAEVGEVTLEVRPADGGLLASLRFPALGIGLEGGERKGLRRFSRSGEIPELGGWWNEHFYATSREPAQARAFLVTALGRLIAVRFREAHDGGMALWQESSRDDGPALEQLVGLARRVAERLPEAVRGMPMPARLVLQRAAWESAARALEADFTPGAPRLEGRDGAWRIVTRWTEDEPRTLHGVRASTPIDARLRFDTGGSAELPTALSRDARPLAEALARDGRLVAREDGLELTSKGVLEDPRDARGRLDRLGRLLRLLRVEEGPYR